MDIKIYNHGQTETLHIPKKYEVLLEKYPLHKVVEIIKKEKLKEQKEKKDADKN